MNALRFDQAKAKANLALARSCDPADEMHIESVLVVAIYRANGYPPLNLGGCSKCPCPDPF